MRANVQRIVGHSDVKGLSDSQSIKRFGGKGRRARVAASYWHTDGYRRAL